MIFPIDNRGLGAHRDVIEQMSTGTSKDRQLLEVLDEVITRNNEELDGKEESEDADDDIEDENKTKNDAVEKSHS